MKVIGALALLALFLCQTVLLPPIQVRGIRPDLILIAIYYAGLRLGEARGAAVGAAAGLLLDLFSGSPPGALCVVSGVMGAAAGLIGRNILNIRALVNTLILGLYTLAHGLLLGFLLLLVGRPVELTAALWRIGLPEALYTAVVGLVCFPLFRWAIGRYPIEEAVGPGALSFSR